MKSSGNPHLMSSLVWNGEMNLERAPAARKILLAAVNGADITLDLSGLSRMDTAGVAVLLEAHQQAQALGHRLTLCGITPSVRAVIAMAQLDGILHLENWGDACAP